MDIDLSKLTRRKVTMTAPADNRTEDEKVFQNVKGMLDERFPKYEGGICVKAVGQTGWNEKTFQEKSNRLFADTCYDMQTF